MTSTALLQSVAPVFHAREMLRGELARDLTRLEIEEGTDGLKTLAARFVAQGGRRSGPDDSVQYLDGTVFDFGVPLRVSLGPAAESFVVFDGFVSAIEVDFSETQAPEVQVFAEDALMGLRMSRRARTYENVTDSAIAEEIGRLNSLRVVADAPGPTHDIVQQWNVSDLAFLRDRARRIQAELWWADGALHFSARGTREGTRLTLTRGVDLIDVRLRADLAHQRTTVNVSGYDARRREGIDEEAGDDAVRAEAGNAGRTGPAVLAAAFRSRATVRTRDVPLVGAEARSWARAEILRRARSFVTVSGTTSGSAGMVVGSRLTLNQVGAPFEGDDYYVTRVAQTYDLTAGHRTHFDAERPTIGRWEGA